MERRIVALDLVRFFAALSVVFYHYISRPDTNAYPLISHITDYGYLGVPLFFIISGYVIMLSASNRSAIQFAISRFVRLYPALWACILFTVLCLYFFSGERYSLLHVLANFTLLNEYLGFDNVDGVYWTLKVELKFYACVFFLLAFDFFQKIRIWLSVWLGLVVIYTIFKQPFFLGWFITPTYSSFFIAGISFYLIQANGKAIYNYFILYSSLILSCIRAYIQADGFMTDPSVIEKSVSVFIVFIMYFIMYFICIGKIKFKDNNLLIIIGCLTYPLYLIHNLAGKALIDSCIGYIPEKVMIVITVIVMINVSLVIHFCIERQFSTPLKKIFISMSSLKR